MIVGRRRTDSVGVCHAGTSAIVAVSYSITCSITSSPSCVEYAKIKACVARRIHNFTIMITLAKNYAHTHCLSVSTLYTEK